MRFIITLVALAFVITCRAEQITPDSLLVICEEAENYHFYSQSRNMAHDWYFEDFPKLVKVDNVKAFNRFSVLAKAGKHYAQCSLGVCYYYGRGTDINYALAAKWFEKSASQGNSYAQLFMGFLYYEGEGVTKSHQNALQWFLKSANNENVRAQWMLYDSYWGDGLEDLVPQDSIQGLKWLRKAANQEDIDSEEELAFLYEIGQGVKRDLRKALSWYIKAADHGAAYAKYNIGRFYENGIAVDKNFLQAVVWYDNAAMQGEGNAKERLNKLRVIVYPFYSYKDLQSNLLEVEKTTVIFDFKSMPGKASIIVMADRSNITSESNIRVLDNLIIDPAKATLIDGADFFQVESLNNVIICLSKTEGCCTIFSDVGKNKGKGLCMDIYDIFVEPEGIRDLPYSQKIEIFSNKSSKVLQELTKLSWYKKKTSQKNVYR